MLYLLFDICVVVIAMRRIGKSVDIIKQAIQELDIEVLSSDHADLLLRVIPTETEVLYKQQIVSSCYYYYLQKQRYYTNNILLVHVTITTYRNRGTIQTTDC